MVLFISFYYLLPLLHLPEPFEKMLLFVMSWPQILTGFFGVILALQVGKKLN